MVNYTEQDYQKEHMARVYGRELPLSPKQSQEICNFIRYRTVAEAKQMLGMVIEKKMAVPFKRFNDGVGHKRGRIAAGMYPVKACSAIKGLLESAEANAQFKGLSTANLKISHISAHHGSKQYHYGRHHGRTMKRVHIQLVVKESGRQPEKPAAPKRAGVIPPNKTAGSIDAGKAARRTEEAAA